MSKETREFHGKTKLDIESQFVKWQQDNAGRVFVIKKHPIKWLPMTMQPALHQHTPIKLADAFSMCVEYEIKSAPRPRARGKQVKQT